MGYIGPKEPPVITPGSIDNSELAAMGQYRLKGRVASGSGDPADLTPDQSITLLNQASTSTLDAARLSSHYRSLRVNGGADLTQRPRVNYISGTGLAVSGADDGTDFESDITIALAAIANKRVLGNVSGSSAAPTALGSDDLFTVLNDTGTAQLANNRLAPLAPSPAGSYTRADVTVDAQGRVTAASSGAAITNTDISGSAEIAVSKLADGAARQVLQTSSDGTGVEWTDNVDLPGTLDVTGQATFDSGVYIRGSLVLEGTTADDFEVTIACEPTADRTVTFPDQSGSVLLSGNASIVNADISAAAAIADSKLATISSAGKVSNSATTAASANTANAIVARDASGNFSAGTITANLTGTASNASAVPWSGVSSKPTTISGYGITDAISVSVNNAFTGANTFTNGTGQTFRQAGNQDGILLRGRAGGTAGYAVEIAPTALSASRTLTAPDVSGTIITTGDTGTVSNAMLAGSIADSKLSTISTAGKVSNSATSATNTNTANAIVARDASGNFSAGTISAALSGNASTATALQTARTIQGVSFDGTANITVLTAGTGVSVSGTQVANTGVLSVNGGTGAISNVAVTNTAQTFTAQQRGTISAIGNTSGTITLDFATANNFSLTLNANSTNTLATPSNIAAGASGVIYITQDATGSRTLAYSSAWDFAGGTVPSLSTAANAVDCLCYAVRTTGSIAATLIKDVK